MALTRKMLKAMGIEDEKTEQIIEAHTETVDALKAERDEARVAAADAEQLRRRLEEAEAGSGEDYRAALEAERAAFAAYKAEREGADAEAQRRALFRTQLEELGIVGKRADAVARAADLSAFEVEGGAFKDAAAVQEAIRADWGDLVPVSVAKGAEVPRPPVPGGPSAVTPEQFAKMGLRERNELYRSDREAYESLVGRK